MGRLDALFPEPIVLTDGAWGTEFQNRGLAPGEPADLWNLSRPDDVQLVAHSYVEAGSRVILTNTFRSNPIALDPLGASDQVERINHEGARNSLRAAGTRALVFGSVGPTGKLLSAGEIDPATVERAFESQCFALAGAGVHGLLFETFSDPAEAAIALSVGSRTGLPIIVSFAFDSGKRKDRTLTGATPEQAAEVARSEGADAVGANCGAGPDAFLAIAARMRPFGLPLWIKPNAGIPTIKDGHAIYNLDPTIFAAHGPGLVEAGARFLGGCCGTTPEHIRALARTLSPCVSS